MPDPDDWKTAVKITVFLRKMKKNEGKNDLKIVKDYEFLRPTIKIS